MSDSIFPSRLKKANKRTPTMSGAVPPVGWEIITGVTKTGDMFWLDFGREWRPLQTEFVGRHTANWDWLPVIREKKKTTSKLARLAAPK